MGATPSSLPVRGLCTAVLVIVLQAMCRNTAQALLGLPRATQLDGTCGGHCPVKSDVRAHERLNAGASCVQLAHSSE